MAQEQGAAGSGEEQPRATGGEVPDSPTLWGKDGLIGEGRYRLTHRLGRGGMAEVFAAEDVRLGRPVAVKLLRSDLAEDPIAKARFTREAQSVAGLNHHAVVAVYDSGEDTMGGAMRGKVVPYIVMELVNGKTIRELLIDADAPPAEQALIIVSGVLEALAYSHQHGIVHRDIKPANVIITDTGTVKVMDFGIARALHGASQTMTQTGMVMGTPQYLSPEQALGKAIDTRSDLYAVGCLLYELLTRRPPFVGETPLAVVYQHVQDMPRLPSEVSSEALPELDGLVMRSLAKDPDDRFQSAEEMRGLVQYALRMLEEHGGHTGGLWNTGPVSSATTPPMGSPTAIGPRAEAPTGQYPAPMLLGDPNGGRDPDRPAGNGQRGRLLLIALLVLVAIGTGVLIAANVGGDTPSGEAPDGTDTSTPTETESAETDPATPTEPEDSEEPTDDDYTPPPLNTPTETGSSTPTETGTPTPSEPETTPPTEPEPTDPPTEETSGGADEGTSDGDTEGTTPTDEPTDGTVGDTLGDSGGPA